MSGPVVRVDLQLGTYTPEVDAEDPEWRPVMYVVHAHHAATLNEAATTVVERQLERLTLRLNNDEADSFPDYPAAELTIPPTLEGIEALITILDNARDYLAQEKQP